MRTGCLVSFWRGQKFADVKRHECGLLVMPGRVVRNEKVVRARRGSKMRGAAQCASRSVVGNKGVHDNMVMGMPGKGLSEVTPILTLEKELKDFSPIILQTLNPVNLKSTGLEMIRDLLGGSKRYGGAQGRDLVEEYKSRMWGESSANNQINFQPCALPGLMGCQGLWGNVASRYGSFVGQFGYDRGHGWPSSLWGG